MNSLSLSLSLSLSRSLSLSQTNKQTIKQTNKGITLITRSLERTICCSINVQIWPVFCKFAYEFTLIAYCIIYTVFDYRYSCSEKKIRKTIEKQESDIKKRSDMKILTWYNGYSFYQFVDMQWSRAFQVVYIKRDKK